MNRKNVITQKRNHLQPDIGQAIMAFSVSKFKNRFSNQDNSLCEM